MTLLHTLMVMGMIWLFFGEVYANVTGLAVSAVIVTVITSNGILEMIVAGFIIPMMMRILRPVLDKLELGKYTHE
jgi:membrane family protein